MSTVALTLPPPHVLVADDDPASLRFLCDGLQALGAQVQGCADGIQALRLASEQVFDLLLLDCRMPGGGAGEILTALRAAPGASSGSLAVASSAELGAEHRRELLARGFHHVLRKPCGIAELQHLLALLPGGACVLDDEAGLRASGDASTMQALRALLRHELTQLHQELEAPGYGGMTLDDRLHRLRSSCGFCGAAALAAAAARLQQRLRGAPCIDDEAIAPFRHALVATLRALDD